VEKEANSVGSRRSSWCFEAIPSSSQVSSSEPPSLTNGASNSKSKSDQSDSNAEVQAQVEIIPQQVNGCPVKLTPEELVDVER